MAEIKYYGLESHFNENVTFYKDVNIQGNLNYDSLTVRNLTVNEKSILGTVKVSSGIVTATSGITTYYGDAANMTVNGSTLASAITGIGAIVPSGVIVMWSGTITNIPTGWALCNGSNGTPDLRSKFIVGATSDASTGVTFNADTGAVSGAYAPGNTGGSVAHQLTTAEMPAHTHTTESNNATGGNYSGGGNSSNLGPYYSTTTGSAGASDFHENRPPYYALAFIMKT
jgi:microcystin-dependent protein